MKKLFIFLVIIILIFPSVSLAVPVSWNFDGSLLRPLLDTWNIFAPANFRFDGELLPDGLTCSNGQILKKTGTNDWDCATDATGGGSGGGTWATTTSLVAGQLLNYPLNTTDIVMIGHDSATSSAEFYFDPNTTTYYLQGNGTTTGVFTSFNHIKSPYFTATSTTATSTISTGGLAVGTSKFVVQQNSGNIGVGILNPLAKVNVDGVIQSDRVGVSTQYVQLSGGNSSSILLNGVSNENNKKFLDITNSYLSTGSPTGNNNIRFKIGLLGSEIVNNLVIAENGNVGIGTTTPAWALQIATGTKPQLTLSDGTATSDHWSMRNAGGKLYIATSSPLTYAISSNSALTINQNGWLGIGSTTPTGALSVIGNIMQNGGYAHFGSADTNDTSTLCRDNGSCLELVGNNNANSGVVLQVENINSGASSWSGYNLLNDRFGTLTTNFSGLFLNSSGYSDATFGFANNFPDLFAIQNTMGDISFMASSTTFGTNSNIKFWTDGVAAGNERMRINRIGQITIATTTANRAQVAIASSTASQLSLIGNSTDVAWNLRNAGGNLYFATSSASTYATGTLAAVEFRNSGTAVGIATSSPWRTFSVDGTVALKNITAATAGTNNDLCISAAGDVVNESTGTCIVSSRRFKHDIKPLDISALDIVSGLKPSTFVRNGEEVVRWGFIAEEAYDSDPHLASLGLDGLPRGLDEHAFLSVIVDSIQELWGKVKSLMSKVTDHESRLEKLERENKDLLMRIEKLEHAL